MCPVLMYNIHGLYLLDMPLYSVKRAVSSICRAAPVLRDDHLSRPVSKGSDTLCSV